MTNTAYATLPRIYCLFSLPAIDAEETIKFSPRDCGFEVGEDEIVSGMLMDLPDCLPGRSLPEVEPEEFESTYGYFLS